MRTLRLAAASSLALMLSTVIAGAAMAQAGDDDAPRSGPFAATVVDYLEVDDMDWVPGPPHGRLDDWEMVVDVDATNPRLDGTWTVVLNGHGFGEIGSPEAFSVYAGTARLENEMGAWTGEVTNLASEPYEHMRLVVEGEGANEGLTAIIDQAGEFGAFQGIVFEYGLPPLPEPIVPA